MISVGLVSSLLKSFLGFSGFVAFLVLGNLPGCVWSFISGVLSSMTLHIYWLKHKEILQDWYSNKELHSLYIAGVLGFTLGVIGIIHHAVLEIILKTPLYPIDKCQVIPIIMALMTAGNGGFLMYTSKKFKSNEDSEILIPN